MAASYKSPLTIALFSLAIFGGLQSPAGAAPQTNPPECIVILDAKSGEALYREGNCAQRFSPFSTFKFALSLIGYDAGILQDEHTPTWNYKAEFHAPRRQQKTTDPVIWERDSIVWFSQQLTRRLGADRFAAYVSKLDYGNHDVSGDAGRNNGLTQAWLGSSLQITPDEEANFVRRFLLHALPVSDKAYDMTQAIIPRFEAGDGWTVHGKTGGGWLRNADGSYDERRPQGWFVGWAERNGQQVVFARLDIGREKSDVPLSTKTRRALLESLPNLVKHD